MSIKTNKALQSRIKVTKRGKLLVRGKGKGHLNAKQSRSKQLASNRARPFAMTNKTHKRFITKRT